MTCFNLHLPYHDVFQLPLYVVHLKRNKSIQLLNYREYLPSLLQPISWSTLRFYKVLLSRQIYDYKMKMNQINISHKIILNTGS